MLSDITVESAPIEYGKDPKTKEPRSFDVYGLSFTMVAQLFNGGDREELQKAVEELEKIFHASRAGEGNVRGRVGAVLAQLPSLAAKVIAVAAKEPKEWMKVEKLPVTVQLNALMEIGRLTFTGEDAVKNFVSGLLSLTGNVTQAVEEMTSTMSQKATALPSVDGTRN